MSFSWRNIGHSAAKKRLDSESCTKKRAAFIIFDKNSAYHHRAFGCLQAPWHQRQGIWLSAPSVLHPYPHTAPTHRLHARCEASENGDSICISGLGNAHQSLGQSDFWTYHLYFSSPGGACALTCKKVVWISYLQCWLQHHYIHFAASG